MALPPFKSRSALVESLNIVFKQAHAVITVSETSWWGLKKRKLRVLIHCKKITQKEPEWSAWVRWSEGYQSIPVCADSDVLELANKTVRDMRHMQMTKYEQLLAHRLQIHMRKHHGRSLVTCV